MMLQPLAQSRAPHCGLLEKHTRNDDGSPCFRSRAHRTDVGGAMSSYCRAAIVDVEHRVIAQIENASSPRLADFAAEGNAARHRECSFLIEQHALAMLDALLKSCGPGSSVRA